MVRLGGAWLAALAALLLALPAAAQMAELRKGRLGHLVDLIGGYDYEPVLNDTLVAGNIARLLGDAAPVLRANLGVHAAIDLIAGNLVLQGNAPHQGYEEEAMLWLRVYDGAVMAALLHAGTFYLYAAPGEWEYLPRELRAFYFPRIIGQAQRPPAGLVWVEPTP